MAVNVGLIKKRKLLKVNEYNYECYMLQHNAVLIQSLLKFLDLFN